MSDFKEDPSEWAESDEREIRPDAIVLRGQEAQEAGRAMLAWAGHITAGQLDAAAEVLFRQVFGHGWEDEPDGVRAYWRRDAAAILAAAGFTVVGEEEA